jgi:hypothetical protein
MHRIVVLSVCSLALSLGGCGHIGEQWSEAGYGVAATPLFPDGQVPGTGDKMAVWSAVNLSEQKCSRFVNGLIAAETGTNTGLDLTTTVLSTLAATFTPLATAHALSAGAAISSGWKTAIDSDVFAKASVANYAQAIQSTYFRDIGAYGEKLAAQTGPIDIGAEFAQIQSIHAECSLGSAQAAIAASLHTGASTAGLQAPPPTTSPHPLLGASPGIVHTPTPPTHFVVPGHAVQ